MNRAEGLEISDDKKRVYLSFEDNLGEAEGDLKIRRGLKFGLKEGTRLKNALDLDDPNAPYYEVAKDSKGYYLQKKESVPSAGGYIQQTQSIVIEPRDLNTLLLCKVK